MQCGQVNGAVFQTSRQCVIETGWPPLLQLLYRYSK